MNARRIGDTASKYHTLIVPCARQDLFSAETPLPNGEKVLAVSCVNPGETAEQAYERVFHEIDAYCGELLVNASVKSLFGEELHHD